MSSGPFPGLAVLAALLLMARGARASSAGHAPGAVPFIAASHFTPASRKPGDVRLIVIHTTEAPKTAHTAHDVATWTAGNNWGANGPVSAHYVVDSDHVIQTVAEHDIAWQARGGDANARGIGVEHAGSAGQSAASWGDDYNRAMLARSAALVAGIAARWGIPARWLSADDVANGAKGITGHREVSDAFNVVNGHGDPGAAFPRAHYIELVRAAS